MRYILIDDDLLIHELWKLAARDASVLFDCYFSVDEFLATNPDASDDSLEIYVDSNLDGVKGEEEVCRLYQKGFKRLHIATGYNPEHIEIPEFVVSVIGKRPPF